MSVYPRADGVYVYDFWLKGVRFYGSTSERSEREARTFERQVREQAKQTVAAVKAQRTAPMTINVAFDRFWVEVGQHYSGTYGKLVFEGLAWMTAEFGASARLADLTANRIAEAIARRRGAGVANATVNRGLTEILRRVFRRARRVWGQEVPDHEWADLLLAEPKERVRELRDHEEAKLTASMRADYLPSIKFKIASGLRLKEIVGLRWSAIDWTARIITIRGKGDKVRNVPLTAGMIAILAPLRDHHPEAVFTYVATATRRRAGRLWRARGRRYPVTYEGLKTVWRRYGGAAAGLEDFRLHDCRHTTGTRLLRDSGNLRLVQRLLGHEDIATTTKYAHADDEDLRRAMEAMEKRAQRVPRNSRTAYGSGE